MSILIKGMEMPHVGTGKVIMIDSDGDVWAAGRDECTIIDGAKAVPIPPHGRLGDLDKLENGLRRMAKYQHGERQQGILGCCETIRLAPTIVPASEESE